MSVPLIEMTDATVSAGESSEIAVVESVNWKVMAGEFWIVSGPPGSGKSNLLLTAAGLLRPASGVHRLFGSNLAEMNEGDLVSSRMRVGFVFGNDGRLFHHMTVAENVAFPLCYHRNCRTAEVRERVASVLKETDLSAHSNRYPRNLNRYLCLQAALARALVLNPELILLDEPLNGAAANEAAWWHEMLGRLGRGNVFPWGRPATFVIGTNDIRNWSAHGNRFARLQKRRFCLVAENPATDPRSNETVTPEAARDSKPN
ncbi:MAG: ATP-binding cassette domain-containing protein [Verrucomicrobia bacterium]|nr:ATP-binding cassette domain-containing protein [Verrucomicrobiota bacterium]